MMWIKVPACFFLLFFFPVFFHDESAVEHERLFETRESNASGVGGGGDVDASSPHVEEVLQRHSTMIHELLSVDQVGHDVFAEERRRENQGKKWWKSGKESRVSCITVSLYLCISHVKRAACSVCVARVRACQCVASIPAQR